MLIFQLKRRPNMTSDSFKRFMYDIQSCSDLRLQEVYTAVIDEMEKRSWENRKVNDAVEALYEYDSDSEYDLALYGIGQYEKI